mmetsp:Transcript_22572/g.56383  ORF Transcript_22572/g.56383 Transcript_22572/m.56383 type:complete len:233 (-) Transcript_22572:261-959(-)
MPRRRRRWRSRRAATSLKASCSQGSVAKLISASVSETSSFKLARTAEMPRPATPIKLPTSLRHNSFDKTTLMLCNRCFEACLMVCTELAPSASVVILGRSRCSKITAILLAKALATTSFIKRGRRCLPAPSSQGSKALLAQGILGMIPSPTRQLRSKCWCSESAAELKQTMSKCTPSVLERCISALHVFPKLGEAPRSDVDDKQPPAKRTTTRKSPPHSKVSAVLKQLRICS